MTDVPWTPGPWFAQPGFLTIYNMSNGTSGLTCAVASVLTEQPGLDQANANARLLAEAPAMAEALERFASAIVLTSGSVVGLERHWFEDARAILARIKGATP